MHGQSEYTDEKQRQLKILLGALKLSYLNNSAEGAWAHRDVLFIDATAGAGKTAEGKDGSPLILYNFAKANFTDADGRPRFQLLCCERDPEAFRELTDNLMGMNNVMLSPYPYQDVVNLWIKRQLPEQKRSPNGHRCIGLMYVDVNGAKDIMDGLRCFQEMNRVWRSDHIDLLFHLDLMAYIRNHAAGNLWAAQPLLEALDELRETKNYFFGRPPKWGSQAWTMLLGTATSRLTFDYPRHGLVPYSEWREDVVLTLEAKMEEARKEWERADDKAQEARAKLGRLHTLRGVGSGRK